MLYVYRWMCVKERILFYTCRMLGGNAAAFSVVDRFSRQFPDAQVREYAGLLGLHMRIRFHIECSPNRADEQCSRAYTLCVESTKSKWP